MRGFRGEPDDPSLVRVRLLSARLAGAETPLRCGALWTPGSAGTMNRRLQARIATVARRLPHPGLLERTAARDVLRLLTDEELGAREGAVLADSEGRSVTAAESAALATYYRNLAMRGTPSREVRWHRASR